MYQRFRLLSCNHMGWIPLRHYTEAIRKFSVKELLEKLSLELAVHDILVMIVTLASSIISTVWISCLINACTHPVSS